MVFLPSPTQFGFEMMETWQKNAITHPIYHIFGQERESEIARKKNELVWGGSIHFFLLLFVSYVDCFYAFSIRSKMASKIKPDKSIGLIWNFFLCWIYRKWIFHVRCQPGAVVER
jgi:hypothetical protein